MSGSNDAQADYWNGAPGRKWVDHDAWMTTNHTPVTALLLGRSGVGYGDRVLDIGCGTGFSTRAASARVGPTGRVTGIDISEPLLAAARRQGGERPPVEYVRADTQTHDFEAGTFDQVISQFGVMFFSDPVAAFANVRRAARPGAGLTLACWASLEDNPWFLIPQVAGETELVPLTTAPGEPSPTAFADRDRVRSILSEAGWTDVGAEAVGIELTPPGDLDELVRMAFTVGPVARLVQHHGAAEEVRDRIAGRIRSAFARYETENGFRVPATINIFTARAPN
jgi:SAM-dependent methyltransferase